MNINPDEYIWSGPPGSSGAAAASVAPPPPQPYLSALLKLARVKKVSLSLATVFTGFLCGAEKPLDFQTLLPLLAGGALSLSGAAVLNQWIERDRDQKMIRTCHRPIPSGRVLPTEALVFGVALLAIGIATLWTKTNHLTAALAGAGAFIYIVIYPYTKAQSILSTHIGAVSGAIPPLLGWTAATGGIRGGGEALFIVLFIWQIPHFMSQAAMHRDDFYNGGYRNLPVIDRDGFATTSTVLFHIIALVPACFLLSTSGIISTVGFICSVALGATQLVCGLVFFNKRTRGSARLLFRHSILHLAILLAIIIAFNWR